MKLETGAVVLGASLSLLAASCTPASNGPASSSDGSGGSSSSGSGGSSSQGGGSGGGKGSGGSSGSGGNASSASGGSSAGGASGGSSGGSGSGGQGPSGTGGGSGGSSGSGGSGAGTGGSSGSDAGTAETGGGDGAALAKFSFFYTSLAGMRRLSGSQNGFGGDLRFGTDNGITGADKICQTLAADEGFGAKTWRAFLSAFKGPDGQPVNAIDRVGAGPWYDRRGRLIAMTKAGLMTGNRPMGDAAAVNDLVDEKGMGKPPAAPNDTHDVITGTNNRGTLRGTRMEDTCNDWTSTTARGTVGIGHAWPAGSGMNWMQAHTESSCAAGVNLVQNGPGNGSSIGAGGGWGGIYCFALTP
jgi:hypothetical protein